MAGAEAKPGFVFDRPIGKNQAVAHPLADSWIRLEAAELMTQKAARLFDEGKPCGPEANAAKFLGSEAGFEAADREQLREKAGMIGRSLFLGFFSTPAKFIADDDGRVVVERC